MGTTWRRSSGSRDLFAGRAREAEGSVGRACADWTRAGQDRQTPLDVLCKPDEQGKQAQQKGGEQGGGGRTHGDARRVQLSPNHHHPPPKPSARCRSLTPRPCPPTSSATQASASCSTRRPRACARTSASSGERSRRSSPGRGRSSSSRATSPRTRFTGRASSRVRSRLGL